MVRMLIGTLLALVTNQITLEYIEDRLSRKVDQTTLYNAESQGLYLVEVFYD